MDIQQLVWSPSRGWYCPGKKIPGFNPQFVIAFGGVDKITMPFVFESLRSEFPSARIITASTAGEIVGTRVLDDSVTATAVMYRHTPLEFVSVHIRDFANSFECGRHILQQLNKPGLSHILVISDGILVNGDHLVKGINEGLPSGVLVTGGLAADAGRFRNTFVGLDEIPGEGNIVAIGHYGPNIKVSHGSKGGWDQFGPVRTVSRSSGNVLFELDGMNALELYKKYLGDRAAELPGSAMLFPLSLYSEHSKEPVVRTILSIDEEAGSMTFAGDIPTHARVQFMMANFDRLVDGAIVAAEQSGKPITGHKPELVLMISCVGRKIVLDQRIEEEVEAVTDFFGKDPVYFGFYSNGEISPVHPQTSCMLHNQTMTITTYSENVTA